jgi:hypothetical protein
MTKLRGERELRGLSLGEVAKATGIPVDILASLEAEPDAQLRAGSTIAKWRDQYVAFLHKRPVVRAELADVSEAVEPTETTTTSPTLRTPVGMARALAMGVALAVVVLLGLKVVSTLWDRTEVESTPVAEAELAADEPAQPAAHSLNIRAIEPSRLRAVVDGEVVHDGVLIARRSLQLEAQRELVLEIPDLTRVKMRYNGHALRPLGNLSAGRRLVFIDDESP